MRQALWRNLMWSPHTWVVTGHCLTGDHPTKWFLLLRHRCGVLMLPDPSPSFPLALTPTSHPEVVSTLLDPCMTQPPMPCPRFPPFSPRMQSTSCQEFRPVSSRQIQFLCLHLQCTISDTGHHSYVQHQFYTLTCEWQQQGNITGEKCIQIYKFSHSFSCHNLFAVFKKILSKWMDFK